MLVSSPMMMSFFRFGSKYMLFSVLSFRCSADRSYSCKHETWRASSDPFFCSRRICSSNNTIFRLSACCFLRSSSLVFCSDTSISFRFSSSSCYYSCSLYCFLVSSSTTSLYFLILSLYSFSFFSPFSLPSAWVILTSISLIYEHK